jgi:hypothetical protein
MEHLYQNIANGLAPKMEARKQLEQLSADYPYCSAFQTLAFALKETHTSVEEQLFSLHKGNMYLNSRTISLNQTASDNNINKLETTLAIEEPANAEPIFEPLSAQDYFASQKVQATEDEVLEFVNHQKQKSVDVDSDANIMITRSFNDWLLYFQQKKEKQEQEDKSKEKLRGLWQMAKLTAAAEEDNEAVPEAVFDKAMSSISPKDDNVSEGLAKVLELQGKYDKCIEMYRKLSLINPEKSAYFAAQIQQLKNKI